MKKLTVGYGMQSLPRDTGPLPALPVTPAELARIGIPAGKLPRILRELDAACRADPALGDRATLLRLARALAALLP